MKKFFALVLSFCLFCGIAFAEGETSENTNTGENKQGSLNLGSLPERKTKSSLEDVLSAQDADRIQKAISDALVSFAEKDESLSVEAWSEKVLQEKMENASKNRVTEIVQEIQDAIRETEEQNRSLAEAVKKGKAKELDGWPAEEIYYQSGGTDRRRAESDQPWPQQRFYHCGQKLERPGVERQGSPPYARRSGKR